MICPRIGVFFAVLLLAIDARADVTNCESGQGTVAYAQCIAAVLIDEEKKLDEAFRAALEKLPERPLSAVQDARKTTEQLRTHLTKAQEAWRVYAQESCAFVGSMQGRGLWVGVFTTTCLIVETRSRIEALRTLPGPP
jgi:uncharacterized protein YecT (DUF1311 family)